MILILKFTNNDFSFVFVENRSFGRVSDGLASSSLDLSYIDNFALVEFWRVVTCYATVGVKYNHINISKYIHD